MTEPSTEPTVPDRQDRITSFRVTTYTKYPKDQPQAGPTMLGSRRLSIQEALQWVLNELPDEAWTVDHRPTSLEDDKVTLTIDWAKVPGRGMAKP